MLLWVLGGPALLTFGYVYTLITVRDEAPDFDTDFVVLKLDRKVVHPGSLGEVVSEDECVYTKEELKDMLETSMSDDYAKWYGDANMYNEVLVDLTNFTKALPFGIAAFVFGLNGLNSAEYGGESVRALRRGTNLLRRFGSR